MAPSVERQLANGCMTLWIAIGLIAAVVALVLVRALRRRRHAGAARAAYDLQVYRDQLDELAADRARGLISAAQATTVKPQLIQPTKKPTASPWTSRA